MMGKLIKNVCRAFWFIAATMMLAALSVFLFDPYYGFFAKSAQDDGRRQRGQELYFASGCQACHGDTGNEPVDPGYPVIAGQPAAYIERQIRDIKSGARSNGLSPLMQPSTLTLSDADIAAIAAYLTRDR